jgi:hypothetical protein
VMRIFNGTCEKCAKLHVYELVIRVCAEEGNCG